MIGCVRCRFDTNRGYSFATEEEYYREYGTSLFAYTYHKGGWDSMRHYEILANGGIPYFLELKRCPPNIMMRFPKTLIRDVMELPGVINTGKVDMRKANLSCLMDVRRKLFDYTRFNLSTVSLARYFLSAMGKPHAKSILMVSEVPGLAPEFLFALSAFIIFLFYFIFYLLFLLYFLNSIHVV